VRGKGKTITQTFVPDGTILDFQSIMMYAGDAGALPGTQTFSRTDGIALPLVQQPSQRDILNLNALYPTGRRANFQAYFQPGSVRRAQFLQVVAQTCKLN